MHRRFQKIVQFFFLFVGIAFVAMALVRGFAPEARAVLWSLLCAPGERIEIVSRTFESETGQIVSAFEVACTGVQGRRVLPDYQLLLTEVGFTIAVPLVLALAAGLLWPGKQAPAPALPLKRG